MPIIPRGIAGTKPPVPATTGGRGVHDNQALRGETGQPRALSHLPFPPRPPVPTVRVASGTTSIGYMIINVSDFDPAVHTLYADAPEPAA